MNYFNWYIRCVIFWEWGMLKSQSLEFQWFFFYSSLNFNDLNKIIEIQATVLIPSLHLSAFHLMWSFSSEFSSSIFNDSIVFLKKKQADIHVVVFLFELSNYFSQKHRAHERTRDPPSSSSCSSYLSPLYSGEPRICF